MTKLFITENIDVYEKVKRLYELYFSKKVVISFSPNGKPFAMLNGKETKEQFNVSHCGNFAVIGVSTGKIGIDCERLVPIKAKRVLSSFSRKERQAIKTDVDFYKNWTAKEAYTKYCGEGIIYTLKKLQFFDGKLYSNDEVIKQNVLHVEYDNHVICICSDDCKEIEIIKYDDL